MPRRSNRRKAPRRRKFKGINVLNVAEAYVMADIWTEAAFRTSPLGFVLGKTSKGFGGMPGAGTLGFVSGEQRIGWAELVGLHGSHETTDALGQVKANLDMNTVIMAAVKTAATGVGFNIMKKVTRKPRSMVNTQILKPLGLADMVRV